MRIEAPTLHIGDGRARLETRVVSDGAPDTLWYSVPERFRDLLSASLDGQLVGLLVPAMARGENITVAGTLSEQLYYNLRALQGLLGEIMPFLKKVEVHPASLSAERTAARGVAMGFSGGIDSFSALIDHHYADVPEGFRITHLLCNNVGAYEGGETNFRRRFDRLRGLPERLNLPFVDVNSNLGAFYDARLHFQQTNTPRNASVALLLGGGIRRFLYASAYHFRDIFVSAYHTTARTDLISLPLVSTESTDCMSVGSEYTRLQKTLKVAELPDSYDFLDVCTKSWPTKNCGCCVKCTRTALTFELAGRLQCYERVFDMAAWRRARSGYIGRVFHDDYPLTREIADFARQVGLQRSAYSMLYGVAWRTKEMVKRTVRPRRHGAPV
jgi:hypothetical protein